MERRCRSDPAAKFSLDELEEADGSLMSRSDPCDLQTPLLELDAPVWRSGATQEPLIRLVGVLTTINPLRIHHYIGRKIKPGCGFNIWLFFYIGAT